MNKSGLTQIADLNATASSSRVGTAHPTCRGSASVVGWAVPTCRGSA